MIVAVTAAVAMRIGAVVGGGAGLAAVARRACSRHQHQQWCSRSNNGTWAPTLAMHTRPLTSRPTKTTETLVHDELLAHRDSILSHKCFVTEVQYFDRNAAQLLQDELDFDIADMLDPSGSGSQQGVSRFVVGRFTEPATPSEPATTHETRGSRQAIEEIADLVVPSYDGEKYLDHYLSSFGATAILRGEVDAVGVSGWQYGFVKHETLSIFDAEGTLAEIGQQDGVPVIRLFDYDRCVPLDSVASVSIRLSDDWTRRSLAITIEAQETAGEGERSEDDGTMMETIEIAVDFSADAYLSKRGPSTTTAESSADEIRDDRGATRTVKEHGQLLMVTTEWMVKAAGSLVVCLQGLGANVQLQLPAPLLPGNNPHVAARLAAWAEAFKKNQSVGV